MGAMLILIQRGSKLNKRLRDLMSFMQYIVGSQRSTWTWYLIGISF